MAGSFKDGAELHRADQLERARSGVGNQRFEILDVRVEVKFLEEPERIVGYRCVGGRAGVVRDLGHAFEIGFLARRFGDRDGFLLECVLGGPVALRKSSKGWIGLDCWGLRRERGRGGEYAY